MKRIGFPLKVQKKFKKFRERNPNDPISKDFKLLNSKKQVAPTDAQYKQLLKKFEDTHLKAKESNVQQRVERDEVAKSEEKKTWPEICRFFKLELGPEDNWELLQRYEKMGWVRTVSLRKQARSFPYVVFRPPADLSLFATEPTPLPHPTGLDTHNK